MRIDVLTLFPEVFEPFLAASIVGRAIEAGILTVRCVNFRDFAHDKHRTADDRPFGGGPGMVLMCGPVFEALEHLEHDFAFARSGVHDTAAHLKKLRELMAQPGVGDEIERQAQELDQEILEAASRLPAL